MKLFLSEEEVNAAWHQLLRNHIRPLRIFKIGVGLTKPLAWERKHLEECSDCKRWINLYKPKEL